MKQLAWLIVVTACASNVQPVGPKPRFPAETPQPATTRPSKKDTSPEKADAAPAMTTPQPATTPPSNKNTSAEEDDVPRYADLLTGEDPGPSSGEHTGGQHPRNTSGRISISGKHAFNQSTLTADLVVTKIQGAYVAGIKRCYRQYLGKDATARGKVEFDFTVNQMGRTVNAKASGFASELDDCLTTLMGGWRFPIPRNKDGDPTDTSFRISLQLAPA